MPSDEGPRCHPPGLSPAERAGLSDLFFSVNREDVEQAKDVCNGGCPVRLECLQAALLTGGLWGEENGVWGGLDPLERRAYIRRHGRRVPELEAEAG